MNFKKAFGVNGLFFYLLVDWNNFCGGGNGFVAGPRL
jgi:hypothetical protein